MQGLIEYPLNELVLNPVVRSVSCVCVCECIIDNDDTVALLAMGFPVEQMLMKQEVIE